MSKALFQNRLVRPTSVVAIAFATLFGVVACQTPPTESVVEEATPAEVEAEVEITEVAAAPDSLTPVKFTLSWLLQGVDAPLMLAMERGYFAEVEKNGLGAADPARLEVTIAQTVKEVDLPETPAVEEVFDDSFLPPLEERKVPSASERKPL
ncbi:MAG: hypothetical protein F6K11_12995 [Leptolyngbya sp. SIO3F4]|nr:hypothetical protein [Leptolyngbya sp. SIO3F4]